MTKTSKRSFKVATAGGFLIYKAEPRHYDVHPDSRLATLFPTFAEADEHARTGVNLLFGRVSQYWDIVVSVSNIDAAAQVYSFEIQVSQT